MTAGHQNLTAALANRSSPMNCSTNHCKLLSALGADRSSNPGVRMSRNQVSPRWYGDTVPSFGALYRLGKASRPPFLSRKSPMSP